MVHREAFPKRGGLLDEVGIIAGLRTQQHGFDQAEVAHARCATEQPQLLVMDMECVVEREVFHLLGQGFVDARPALHAACMQPFHSPADAALRGFG